MGDASQAFLDLADPSSRTQAEAWLHVPPGQPAWAALQSSFLEMVGAYGAEELTRGPRHLTHTHEAGGNWRILFPHLHVRPDDTLLSHLGAVLAEQQAVAAERFHLNYPDECEVHHDPETFLYFQIPLFHLGGKAAPQALRSIETIALHCGNWTPGIPAWYDWPKHGFHSTWLGTRRVRDFPPHDYQEANHFRFISIVLAAWLGTRDDRFMNLATDYADRWCRHIEDYAAAGRVIPCQILPQNAVAEELGNAGRNTRQDVYQVFYATVATNTAFDIVQVLLDLFRVTGNERYVKCARQLLNPFFENGKSGQPALMHAGGHWIVQPKNEVGRKTTDALGQWHAFVCRMALKHDLATHTDTYRQPLLDWARTIDETEYPADQGACDVMATAHHLTGDPDWLRRGYQMALRAWAVCQANLGPHHGEGANCNVNTRYGSKFIMESLYLPLLGGCDWGTRGGIPNLLLRHQGETGGLPLHTAFRLWRNGKGRHFEAVNLSSTDRRWSLQPVESVLPGKPHSALNTHVLNLPADGEIKAPLD